MSTIESYNDSLVVSDKTSITYQAAAGVPKRSRGRRGDIACIRCRHSKIKCINEGVESVCKMCKGRGTRCYYDPPKLLVSCYS
jgi:hypothetical protein